MASENTSNRNRFHALKVTNIVRETNDSVAISLKIEEDQKELFTYIQGQYLTFKLNINGLEVRRSYSICTAMYEDELKVAVKKVEGGTASVYLNEELKIGDELLSMPPQGNFYTPLHSDNQKNYVAFAAGSGITPVMSILKTTLNTEQKSTFTLIYGNRTTEGIIFKDELTRLKTEFGNRLQVFHVISQEAVDQPFLTGRINRELLTKLTNQQDLLGQDNHYFLCGPVQMIDHVTDFLTEKGIPQEAIHFELFTTPVEKENKQEEHTEVATELSSDNEVSQVTILLDGDETVIELKKDGPSVLEAAIATGIDPPYSCQGGVCSTCLAKTVYGKVKMDLNYSLTDGELEEGYILTCQSHPITDELKVSYDDN